MHAHQLIILFILYSMLFVLSAAADDADMILINGTVWTADNEKLWTEAIAVRGDRIIAAGNNEEMEQYKNVNTEVIDLGGRFVVPGFIDNHTHFNRAGELIFGINLLDVADTGEFIDRVRGAHDRLPEGAWIHGGDWGAYEDWEMGEVGTRENNNRDNKERFTPHREMIDSITVDRGVLLSRWDRSEYLANAYALQKANLSCDDPVEGLVCKNGSPTGIVTGDALEKVRGVIPQKKFEQRLAEARAALERLRKFGVTGIHDITTPEQMKVFQYLRDNGELTTRVYARPTLDKWKELAAVGITHGFGDEYLKIGGLKGFVDGIMGNSTAQFYEPFDHNNEFGIWRDMMYPENNMQQLIIDADAAGLVPQIHAIGDRAIDSLLTMYEYAVEVNEPRDRRFRIIHTQHLRDASVADRIAENDIIAEMQPFHAIDDMRWMEERIGGRARWAYAFRTLHDAGVMLSFGSDWPGTSASWYPADPLLGIYAAVTRKTVEGTPGGGWYPEERIDVETALRAYTINNAYAAFEEAIKGSISPGKLADIVVLDRNIFEIDPMEIKDAQVTMTVLGGEVIYVKD